MLLKLDEEAAVAGLGIYGRAMRGVLSTKRNCGGGGDGHGIR